jgi:hypothetical protein
MIDARVDDALIGHQKKVFWQQEQEVKDGTKPGDFRSSKDRLAFMPPNGALPGKH